jgi:Putative prokaryotic signal transducing protein
MKHCSYCGHENLDTAVVCKECGAEEFGENTGRQGLDSKPTSVIYFAKDDFVPLSQDDMQNELVTLMRCRTLLDADMVVAQLESAGIAAFIPDQFLMQSISWNLNTYGFVRVQVSPQNYVAAREFLLAVAQSE